MTNIKVILYFLIGYISFLLPMFSQQTTIIIFLGIVMCLITSVGNLLWALLGT
ncbi:hypothetical protein DSM07_10345 [Oenococcus sp. UCMA 16435]|nr:hypothetical protein DSM07_10345 [Oenococcus sp. UCMA 16435]